MGEGDKSALLKGGAGRLIMLRVVSMVVPLRLGGIIKRRDAYVAVSGVRVR